METVREEGGRSAGGPSTRATVTHDAARAEATRGPRKRERLRTRSSLPRAAQLMGASEKRRPVPLSATRTQAVEKDVIGTGYLER